MLATELQVEEDEIAFREVCRSERKVNASHEGNN